MANGFDFGRMNSSANAYQSPNRRYSQMLLQSLPQRPRRGNIGLAADLLQSGLGAYFGVKDIGQQQAAQQVFASGAKGGDLKAAMSALEGLSGNPYAQNRLQNLLMQQVSQSQKEKQRLKELGSERETYAFQQKHKAFAPTKLVSGRDVPYAPEVQRQRVERAQAAKPSWGQMPGVPGMMVSSTGQMQAVPQTPQQAAQTKLETEAAQAQAQAKRGFPQVREKAQETLANLQSLREHPGLPGIIGAPDTISGAAYKAFGVAPPGTDEAGFLARLDQIGGQQFLQAFESLKGGGAITEVEGKKATEAMSRLTKTGLSEDAYRLAISDLENVVKKGLARASAAAGMGQPQLPGGQVAPIAAGMGQPQLPGGQVAPIAAGMGQPQLPGGQVAPIAVGMGQPQLPGVQLPSGVGQDLLSVYNRSPVSRGDSVDDVIQVQSIEQAMQLPPGTRFLTPDGRMKTR